MVRCFIIRNYIRPTGPLPHQKLSVHWKPSRIYFGEKSVCVQDFGSVFNTFTYFMGKCHFGGRNWGAFLNSGNPEVWRWGAQNALAWPVTILASSLEDGSWLTWAWASLYPCSTSHLPAWGHCKAGREGPTSNWQNRSGIPGAPV